MKNGLIVYSSQSGTTRKVAENISAGLTISGFNVDIFDINEKHQLKTAEYDFIGIGSPTYMFRPSYAVIDYIDKMGDLGGKPMFTFVTYGSEIGDGANWLRMKLRRRRAIDLGHFLCRGENLFPGYTNRGHVFSPDSPTKNELTDAEAFGRQIASRLKSKNYDTTSVYDKTTHIVSRFERFVTNRFFTKVLYSYFFSADKKLCNSCGTCVSVCPAGNITIQDKRSPQWGHNCILCLTCEITCPQRAVSTPISWIIFSPFLNYNIWRAKRKGIAFSKTN
jgi:flavodoxin/NAD-dependent dihydropyrimidine dehydrogenase PreA subunit